MRPRGFDEEGPRATAGRPTVSDMGRGQVLAGAVAVEEVHQAVVVLGDEQRDPQRVVGAFEPPPHLEPVGERREAP